MSALAIAGFFLLSCAVPNANSEAWRADGSYERSAIEERRELADVVARAQALGKARLPDRLTLRQAFLVALEANKDIKVASLSADAAKEWIASARGAFDPRLSVDVTRGRWSTPIATVPLGRYEYVQGRLTARLSKRFVTGTTADLSASTMYSRTLTAGGLYNPSYKPDVKLSLRQDLLKNFGININRNRIMIAQNNWAISRDSLENRIIGNLYAVESAYWNLYYALADLKVSQKQLERARQLVQKAEEQVKAGVSEEVELVRAEAGVARLVVSVDQASDRVTWPRRNLLRLLSIQDTGTGQPEFQLVDTPPTELHETSVTKALGIAFRCRPDYRQASLRVRNAELSRRFARNQKLPTLQLFGEYGLKGVGKDFHSSVDVLCYDDYNQWEVGLRFDIPIPNRAARSRYRGAQIQYRISEVQLDAVVERVTREVQDALADLQTTQERIGTTRKSRELAEQELQAEEEAFSAGRSTSRDVLAAHGTLATAERDEARARRDYAKALSALFKVQGNFQEEKGIPAISP